MAEQSKPHTLWDNIFSLGGDEKTRSKLDIMASIPIFDGLTRRELARVSKLIHDRTYEEGEFIFELGQPGAAYFIIKSGEIAIVVPGKSGDPLTLATLGAGASVGELALLDASPRSASARATQPTEAMAFFRADLDKLLETDPLIGSKIYKTLASIIGARLRATNERLEEAELKLKKK